MIVIVIMIMIMIMIMIVVMINDYDHLYHHPHSPTGSLPVQADGSANILPRVNILLCRPGGIYKCMHKHIYISKNIALQIMSVQIGVDVKYKSACMQYNSALQIISVHLYSSPWNILLRPIFTSLGAYAVVKPYHSKQFRAQRRQMKTPIPKWLKSK